ncbi:hypothetical protein Poli38472_005110 [Pythium oligandrum]|uniref:Chitinase domain-containing protein 1 n=1 Tax=Pythium oligandrum TaxID=41045 RepID=A0A8K1FK63_PYTOL|nr:hypothetical protein Poli38472_005110 [Pythium oligandrum]|eukprot:TMW62492.1 hypothetical protein Poli38472_005110 [Pythium oligandrum]
MLWTLVVCVLVSQSTRVAASRYDAGEDEDDEDADDTDGFDFLSTKLESIPKGVETAGSGACDVPGLVESVVKRGLVTPRPTIQSILQEHSRAASDVETRAFQGETLGYVTPWNNRGYDWAKQFRRKFTYIAPVWLQIREDSKTKTPIITGSHDIDDQWVADVRGGDGKGPKLVPRVVYERNRLNSNDVPVIIDLLVKLARERALDGFVFEIPIIPGTMDMLLRVGEALQDADKLLLLVLTRSSNEGALPVTHEMLIDLLPVVHRFTMNAYDYHLPGPNAPLDWIESTLEHFTDNEKPKILMGIPFYGYDGHDAIVGSSFAQTLKTHAGSRLQWDGSAHECLYRYTGDDEQRHVVYYPCLQFLADRLQLFQDHGVGVAVWELGQGLEYFYDLL